MLRLAHISDIHLGPLPALTMRQLASKRITGYVNWHRNRRKRLFGDVLDKLTGSIKAMPIDHIAVTGDLINLATEVEIEAARVWLEELGAPHDVSVVPGNHDAYVPGALAKACAAWRPYMTGDNGLVAQGTSKMFPYLRVRKDVALIGVSSANASAPFLATGDFDRHDAKGLRALLTHTGELGLFRVILIHHPPVRDAAAWNKRLIGIGRFQKIVKECGAELILHGHTHLPTIHTISRDGAPDIPVVGITSASEGPDGKKPAGRYNIFTIARTEQAWFCEWEAHGVTTSSGHIERIDGRKLL